MNENNNGFDPYTGQPLGGNDGNGQPGVNLSKEQPQQDMNGMNSQPYNSAPNGGVDTGFRQEELNRQGYVDPNLNQMPNQQGYNPNGYGSGYNNGYNPNGYNQNYNNGYNPNGYNPNYQQYGYQNPYAGYGQKSTKGLATASMICGIVSVVLFIFDFVFPLFFAVPIVGLVLGIVHKTKNSPEGRGMSTAGIILSVIGLVLPIALIVVSVAMLPSMLEYMEQNYPDMYEQFYDQYSEQMPQYFSSAFAMLKNLFIK